MGGLGNQLFQYCAGRAIARKHSGIVKLDTGFFEKHQTRRYALGHFLIDAVEISRSERQVLGLANPASRLGRLANRTLRWSRSISTVREKGFEFDPSILDCTVPCYLQGYWQSPKYFAEIETEIRRELVLREPISGNNRIAADSIASSISVSVHVRRGDYAASAAASNYHGTCDSEYYRAAEALLRQRLGNIALFVFSDDPGWVLQNLRFVSPATIVQINGPMRDHEDLRLMSLCRHHIIANSTFSWWGAWLCANPDKIVIAPQRWFREAAHSTRDLIPEDWIRI